MAEITMTEFRKNIFQLVDRMIETGEPIRLTRRGRPLLLELVKTDKPTLEQEYEALMSQGVREDAADFDAGDPSDASHWEWNPDAKPRA